MVRQCAWCRNFFGEKEPYDDPTVTHGICLPCADQMLQEADSIPQANPVEKYSGNSLEISEKV